MPSPLVWICDVNGVLIDSVALIRDAFTATAAYGRRPLTDETWRLVNGCLLPEAYRRLEPDGDPVARSRVHLAWLRERLGEVRAYPDVADTLAAARAAGVRIAAVTSYGEIAEACLVRTGLYHLIDCLVTQEEVTRPKPDPEALVRALELLGLGDPSWRGRAIHIGDTAIDIQAGKAAGVRTVAVTYGAAHEDDLSAEHPDAIVPAFGALRAFLPEAPPLASHQLGANGPSWTARSTDFPADRVLSRGR